MSAADETGLGLGGDAGDGGHGLSETPLILLWVIVTVAFAAYVLHTSETNAQHDPLKQLARGDLTERSATAMFRTAPLTRAIATIRPAMQNGEAPASLHLDVGTVSAQVVDRFDNERTLTVDLAYHVRSFPFGKTTSKTFPLPSVDTGAPERFYRTVRAHVRGGTLEDMTYVPSGSDDRPEWLMNLTGTDIRKGDTEWVADGHGRDVRHQGVLSVTARHREACLRAAHSAEAVRRCER